MFVYEFYDTEKISINLNRKIIILPYVEASILFTHQTMEVNFQVTFDPNLDLQTRIIIIVHSESEFPKKDGKSFKLLMTFNGKEREKSLCCLPRSLIIYINTGGQKNSFFPMH